MNNYHSTNVDSLNEKKIALRGLYELVNQQYIQDGELQQVVARLISCFSSDPEVIALSCEILVILMEIESFAALSINVFRKFFRFLPFFFQNREVLREKTRAVQLLTRCLTLFEQNCHLIGQLITDFPFSMLFHLSMLIFNQRNEMVEHEVMELIFQTLHMIPHLPKPHREDDQKIVRKLITSYYTALRSHDSKDLTLVSHLFKLSECLMKVFLLRSPNERHYWIEHRIANIYGVIFDRLFGEMQFSKSAAVDFLLTTVCTFFQRDLNLNLKLEITQQLLDRSGGLRKTLKQLYDLTKTDSVQFTQFKAAVTEIITHYVWQFEFGSTNEAFHKLKQKIHNLIQEVTWSEVMRNDFLISHLRAEGITASNLWLIILVSHFEAEQAKCEWTGYTTGREMNHVLNLTTFLSVCGLKQYEVPKYLVKYVLEGIANFYHLDIMRQTEATYKDQLRQLVPINCTHNIFGLMPVSIPRLKWFKQCNLQWEAKFIQRQRIEALGERLLPLDVINATLLNYLPMELLFSVLCTNSSTHTAQTNASTIMSRVQLSHAIIEKIIDEKLTIRRGCGSKWLQYLRALFGSLGALSAEQQDKVMVFLFTKLNSKVVSSAGHVLLIDILTRILIARQQNRDAPGGAISNLVEE